MSKIGKSKETENILVVSRWWEEGEEERPLMGSGSLFGVIKSVLELDSGEGYTAL